jgi:YaiO family outer membrane protein
MIRIAVLVSAMLLAPAVPAAATLAEGLELKRAQRLDEAARVFAGLLAADASDLAAREQLAVVLGWQGRHDEAIAHWRIAQVQAPGRVDLRVNLARVLYWKGERREALAELDAGLRAEPQNYEALVLKGDVLLADGQVAAARAAYETARGLSPAAEDRELERKLARAQTPAAWSLNAGALTDHFSNSRGDEAAAYLQLGYSFSSTLSAYLHYDWLRQFDAVDNQVLAGAYWRPLRKLLLHAEIGGTASADFRPDSLAQVDLEWLLDGPLQPLLGYRFMSYDVGDVHTLTPGLRWLFLDRADLELRYAASRNIDASNTGVVSARLGLSFGAFSPYLAWYDGDEALPPQPKASFTTVAAGVVWAITPVWSLRGDFAYEDRPGFYSRRGGGLGVGLRF